MTNFDKAFWGRVAEGFRHSSYKQRVRGDLYWSYWSRRMASVCEELG